VFRGRLSFPSRIAKLPGNRYNAAVCLGCGNPSRARARETSSGAPMRPSLVQNPREFQTPVAGVPTTPTGYHQWHRSYAAELGRFGSRDPVGFAAGVNLYEYVWDSPTNRTDPTGEQFVPGTPNSPYQPPGGRRPVPDHPRPKPLPPTAPPTPPVVTPPDAGGPPPADPFTPIAPPPPPTPTGIDCSAFGVGAYYWGFDPGVGCYDISMSLSECHINSPATLIPLTPGGCASGSGAIDLIVTGGMNNPFFNANCRATRSCAKCCPIVDKYYSTTTPVALPIPFDGTGLFPYVVGLSRATCIALYTGTCQLHVKVMIGTCGK
jgi:RHS repeat-associated protein